VSSEGPRDTTLPGFTPNFLVFGREKKAPIDLVLGPVTEDFAYQQKAETYDEFVEQQIGIYQESYQIARAQLGHASLCRTEGPRDARSWCRGAASPCRGTA